MPFRLIQLHDEHKPNRRRSTSQGSDPAVRRRRALAAGADEARAAAHGARVTVCPDGLTAVAALEKNTYDCLLVDLDMPGLNGIEVIAKAKELSPDTEAVVLTGKSSLETAIAALRHGAFDYLTKPCKLVELEALLNASRAGKAQLTQQVPRAEAPARAHRRHAAAGRHIGRRWISVRTLIAKVAPTNSTVLILGETGTGKELVARPLHDQSPRAEKPFVAVNCGALPETLIESELFGHRKGAFTGADEHRVGLFEVANGGTLFLDEIGELPKAMQAKLLRVLESGEIRRVGENEPFMVDVRVVCATHRDLPEMVADGRFPRRPDVPHQHVRDPPAAAARADRRHRRNWPSTCSIRFRRQGSADDRHSPSDAIAAARSRTPGPATSASWPT